MQSTLLHCLLGELKPLTGNVDIVGSLGYAAQDPWVFSGTLRENILFGREFDGEWFQQVVDACCLNEDFKQLPYGEATPVGERGVTLSGGQKARVTLARWVAVNLVLAASNSTLEMRVCNRVFTHVYITACFRNS